MDARQALLLMAGGESYQEAVLSLSPVGYWPLGEATPGTGVCRDLTGANNGTYVGSPTGGVAGPLVGDASTAVTTEATKYVSIPNAAVLHPAGPVGLALWFKRSATIGHAQVLFDFGWGDFALQFSATDHLEIWCSSSGPAYSTTAAYTDTNWHFAVATKDAAVGAGALISVDCNVPAGTPTSRAISPAASALRIGSFITTTGYDFIGSLAHVAIWNRVPTAAEVAYLYAVGKGTA